MKRRRQRRDRSGVKRTRTLGVTAYVLLTVIALAVAVTVAMAIVDPSA